MESRSTLRTIRRTSQILNCFTPEEPVLTLAALSQRVGLPRSTVHRLLSALECNGIVARTDRGRAYRLGWQLICWGTTAQETLALRNNALPLLRQLADRTGETACLAVRDENHGLYLEKIDGPQPVRTAVSVGQRLDLDASASGKALLAFLPEDEMRRILDAIGSLCPLAELQAIRRQGYAAAFEAIGNGAMDIAAPVFDPPATVLGSIGVAAPIDRVTPERASTVALDVIAAARSLSRQMHAQGFPPCVEC